MLGPKRVAVRVTTSHPGQTLPLRTAAMHARDRYGEQGPSVHGKMCHTKH